MNVHGGQATSLPSVAFRSSWPRRRFCCTRETTDLWLNSVPAASTAWPISKSAAFQAILESPMQLTKLDSAWFLAPGYKVQLTNHSSYPLIADLGIRVDTSSAAEVALGFQTYWTACCNQGR